MAKLFMVRVRPDYRWRMARVAGREFSKAPEVLNEAYVNDEMRASDLLVIEPAAGETEPVKKPSSRRTSKKAPSRRTSKKAPKAPPEGGDG